MKQTLPSIDMAPHAIHQLTLLLLGGEKKTHATAPPKRLAPQVVRMRVGCHCNRHCFKRKPPSRSNSLANNVRPGTTPVCDARVPLSTGPMILELPAP